MPTERTSLERLYKAVEQHLEDLNTLEKVGKARWRLLIDLSNNPISRREFRDLNSNDRSFLRDSYLEYMESWATNLASNLTYKWTYEHSKEGDYLAMDLSKTKFSKDPSNSHIKMVVQRVLRDTRSIIMERLKQNKRLEQVTVEEFLEANDFAMDRGED